MGAAESRNKAAKVLRDSKGRDWGHRGGGGGEKACKAGGEARGAGVNEAC